MALFIGANAIASNSDKTEASHHIAELKICTLQDVYCESEEVPETKQADYGLASWYDYSFTSDDQICRSDDCYSMFKSTCASRDYKRGTRLLVSFNGKSVECLVNDFGPEAWTGRSIDLSSYAFKQLSPLSVGVIKVLISEI